MTHAREPEAPAEHAVGRGTWLVKGFLRHGVRFVTLVGADCLRAEKLINEFVAANGSPDRFILTAAHPGETVDAAVAFTRCLTGDYEGDEVQVIEMKSPG